MPLRRQTKKVELGFLRRLNQFDSFLKVTWDVNQKKTSSLKHTLKVLSVIAIFSFASLSA